MTNPTQDRNYYRMLTDEELLDIAKSIRTTELEVALAERLKKAKRKLEGDYYERQADHHAYDSQFD